MADTTDLPLVTIGLCCYNREEGLKNALRYLTGQTYKNLEIIVSQDYHPEMDFTRIIESKNDERVKFYKQPERLSMYRNFGFVLGKATGEYFMWASDDDWWAPEFVEIIISKMIDNPTAAAGHSNFYMVNEQQEKLVRFPDYFPFIKEFSVKEDIRRLKNYINQFEAFGKPNLIYSIFKTSAVKTKLVFDILKDCELWGDMLVVMAVLTNGELVVPAEVLRTATAENEKTYKLDPPETKRINLGIAYLYWNRLKHLHKKWARFIYLHFRVINRSELSFKKKVFLYPTLIKKLFLFYYDLITYNIRFRGYDFFSLIRRSHSLN
ncbi:MAG TPA: glycosyltransferase family 2 protein [Mucilaginibacter sp.]|nr:glycosyltransferase family 2 protein [Mucilaginibacter sp.]